MSFKPHHATFDGFCHGTHVLFEVLLSQKPETCKMINKGILFPARPLLGEAPGQCVELPAAASNQDPDCLERVELNTALAMKAELQSLQVYTVFQNNHHRTDYQLANCWLSGNPYVVLQGSQFNSQKAIQEILQRSERTVAVFHILAN